MQLSRSGEVRRVSEVPTTSSVYSQPSPDMSSTSTLVKTHPPRSSSLCPENISPPDSLHVHDEGTEKSGRSSPDVSPVSNSPSPSSKHSPISTISRFNSNLPVPKKTRKFWNRPNTESLEQGSSLTHWDVYSGEPTTIEKGKPPSTTPNTVRLHADPSPSRLNGYGNSTHISSGNVSGKGVIGRKRVASRDLANTTIIRPEWRGAGGRHKIVNPLLDKPLPPGKSATFPAGSEKYLEGQRERNRKVDQRLKDQEAQLERQGKVNENAERQRKQAEEERTVDYNKVLPNDLETLRGQRLIQPKDPSESSGEVELSQHASYRSYDYEASSNDQTPLPSEQQFQAHALKIKTRDARSPLARNPSTEEIQYQPSQILPIIPPTNSTMGQQPSIGDSHEQAAPYVLSQDTQNECDLEQNQKTVNTNMHHMHFHDEPSSRFSTTTYATTSYESPPATPEVGTASPSVFSTPNSILNRKRPVTPAGVFNAKVAARKPTPSEVNPGTQLSSESKRKSLPKSPPEVNAVSRVASLQAKLENLRRRKSNLKTVILELTHVVQPSSIAYDMASRQEIKKTVEGLNKELAEIQKDEHETGLKLHRTMKRDDEFAAYEPTSIWVRRVTS